MRTLRNIMTCVLAAVVSSAAPLAAQDAPAESTETETSAPAPANIAADAEWSAAIELLEQRRFAEAQAAFAVFAGRYPEDERARYANSVSDALRTSLDVNPREVAVTSQLGRIEVVVFSTIWGLGTGALLGAEISDLTDSTGSKLPLWTSIGAGGAGLALSLLLTKEFPPTAGQAALISSAGVWGYGLGAELAAGTGLGTRCERDEWGSYCNVDSHWMRLLPVAASSAALVGAVVVGRRYPDISTGDVALLNSAAAWGTATSLELALIAEHDGNRAPFDVMLAGTSIGIGTGIVLANRFNVSRSRVGLINLSGILGAGLGAAVAATAEVDTTPAWGGLLLAGQTTGLALGAVLTRQRTPRVRAAGESATNVNFAPFVARGERGTYRGISVQSTW